MCGGAKLNLLPFNSNIFTANIVSITNDLPLNRVNGSTDKTTVTTYLDWENKSECGKDASNARPATMGLSDRLRMVVAARRVVIQARDVDPKEPWSDGRDRTQDEALPV